MNAPIVADAVLQELEHKHSVCFADEVRDGIRETLIATIEHWEKASIEAGRQLMDRTKEAWREVEHLKTLVGSSTEKDQRLTYLGRKVTELTAENARLAREHATGAPLRSPSINDSLRSIGESLQKIAGTIATARPLFCTKCGKRHVDRGEWASRLHRTHLCESCKEEFTIEAYVFGTEETFEDRVLALTKQCSCPTSPGCDACRELQKMLPLEKRKTL